MRTASIGLHELPQRSAHARADTDLDSSASTVTESDGELLLHQHRYQRR
jgi:hypothetical protein